MAYHHGAACEIVETFLECAQGVHVDVVGGFVEQQHISFLFQCHGQVQAVAFTAGEHAYFLFLVGAGEVESREVGAGIDVAPAHAETFYALRYHLVDAFLRQKVVVALVDIGYFHGFADLECSAVGLFLAHDEAEKGGFAGAVGTYHTHDAVRRQREGKVAEECFLAVGLCQV